MKNSHRKSTRFGFDNFDKFAERAVALEVFPEILATTSSGCIARPRASQQLQWINGELVLSWVLIYYARIYDYMMNIQKYIFIYIYFLDTYLYIYTYVMICVYSLYPDQKEDFFEGRFLEWYCKTSNQKPPINYCLKVFFYDVGFTVASTFLACHRHRPTRHLNDEIC